MSFYKDAGKWHSKWSLLFRPSSEKTVFWVHRQIVPLTGW